MRKWLLGLAVLFFVSRTVYGQESYTDRANAYISQYSQLAIQEQQKNGIPAAITLAQGILETEAGASVLCTDANNHFGIKCRSDWTGETFTHTDDAPNECFRKYSCAEESYKDHSTYLTTSKRYAALFDLPVTDYKDWAKGLKRCGYATSPTYAQRLIKIIEDFNLQDYTYAAADKKHKHKKEEKVEVAEVVQEQPVITNAPQAISTKAYKAGQEVTVNGLKAIYVTKGEALLPYAVKYKIRYEHLLSINDMEDDAPAPYDMYIYLEKKNYRGVKAAHVVQAGETLYQIAQSEGVQLRRLMMLNHIIKKGEEPVAGVALQLQQSSERKPKMIIASEKQHEQPVVQQTATPASTAYVATKRTEQKRGSANDKHTVTAYIQKGDTIEKVELPKEQKKIVTTNNIVTASVVQEKVTSIPVNENKITTQEPPVNRTKDTITNDDNKDPLLALKNRLDKVVYNNDNRNDTPAVNKITEAPKVTDQQDQVIRLTTHEKGIYVVKKGDTAFGIARKYNIKLSQLLEWNDIDKGDIKEGMKLKVKK